MGGTSSRSSCAGEEDLASQSAVEQYLEEPWRKIDNWEEEYKQKLLKDIKENAVCEKEIENIRILLVGQIQAGKSSFINSVASVDKGRIAQCVLAGSSLTSMTRKLQNFIPGKHLKNFELLDTMGIEASELKGLNIKDILYLVKGNVPPHYKFNPAEPIDEETYEFKKYPSHKEKIHCLVFVVDAAVAGQENIPDAVKQKIKAVQDELRSQDIPRIVLLTKIDKLCETIRKDITNVYESRVMKKAVDVAKMIFCVPEQNVFPVQNFSDDTELDHKKEILILLALRQMVYFASDFLESTYKNIPEQNDDSST